jgi:hypothetical protein
MKFCRSSRKPMTRATKPHRSASMRGSTTPRISVSRYCPAFFEGIPCQWRRRFSLLRHATSRLSTKTSGTRLAGWHRKIPNLLSMPAESRRDSLRSGKECFWHQLLLRAFPRTLIQSWSRGLLSGVRHPGTTLRRRVELVFSLVPQSDSHQGHLLFSPSSGRDALGILAQPRRVRVLAEEVIACYGLRMGEQ